MHIKRVGLILFLQSAVVAANGALQLTINEHTFTLQISKTTEEVTKGLMFLRHLPERTGMIFMVDPKINSMSMWMKNTYIPLDMLFIGLDRKIACLVKNTKPESLDIISCPYPTTAVIEINGGEADKYHLVKGMEIKELNTIRFNPG